MEKGIEKVLTALEKGYPKASHYLTFSNPLELMVASILSAQVRDEVVNARTSDLFKKYKNVDDYANADLKDLEKIIKPISFYRNKAKNIKKTCKLLVEKYQGDVPRQMGDLIALPGIARKTANVIQQNAFGIVEGIVIDTHCIRVGYRLGWTKKKDPKKIEQDFMQRIEKKYWKAIPYLLKGHGKAVCKAPIPTCSGCLLNKLCPKQGATKWN